MISVQSEDDTPGPPAGGFEPVRGPTMRGATTKQVWETKAMIIRRVSADYITAQRVLGGEIAAEARRVGKGFRWRVWFSTYIDRTGYGPPHVRINGKLLPEAVQQKLIHTLLEGLGSEDPEKPRISRLAGYFPSNRHERETEQNETRPMRT